MTMYDLCDTCGTLIVGDEDNEGFCDKHAPPLSDDD